MAELAAFGVAASVAQFVSIAGVLASQINEFLDSTQQAPKVFRDISLQLPFLVEYCQDLDRDPQNSENIRSVITGCSKHVEELSVLITKLLPTAKDTKIDRVWKATQSVLRYEKKLLTFRQTLEEYKTSLQLCNSQQRRQSRAKIIEQKSFLPPPPITLSITRHQLLRDIDNKFDEYASSYVGPRIVIVLGMGGQGKSRLALDYCQDPVRRTQWEYIVWFDATSKKTLVRSYEDIADRLTARKRAFPDAEARITFVKETLTGTSWLLVFDNFDNPSDLKDIHDFLPNGSGSVLFTTRHKDSSRLGKTIYLERMEKHEGRELLLRHIDPRLVNRSVDEEASKILEKLGHLPLAIDQASVYIEDQGLTLKQFSQEYGQTKREVLAHHHMYWDYKKRLKDDEKNETPLSVLTTWEMSFQQISNKENRRCAIERLLTVAAFLGNVDVKESLFKAYNGRDDGQSDWLDSFAISGKWNSQSFREAVAELLKLSLVQNRSTETGECCLSLHPMIRDWLQLRIDEKAQRKHLMEAIIVVANFVETSPPESLHAVHREILEHQDACWNYQEIYLQPEDQLGSAHLRGPAITFSSYYTLHGRHREAEGPLQSVLDNDKIRFGEVHPTTLVSMRTLADVHTNGGQYEKAHLLLSTALVHSEKVRGKTAMDSLKLLSSLAVVCMKEDRNKEAEGHFESALAGHDAQAVRDDTEILSIVENLATVKRFVGKHSESAKLFAKALLGYEQQRGADGLDTPDTLRILTNYAHFVKSQSQYEEAEQLYRRAWTGYKRLFGPNHPDTTNTLTYLGITYRNQEKYVEAERYIQEAADSLEKVHGRDHPNTLRARNNLATCIDKQGHYRIAEGLYREILKGREAKLGPDHHYTLRTSERLAWMLWKQDRRDEANELAARILKASKKPPTVDKEKQYSAIESLYRRSQTRHSAKNGPDHIDLLETEECLAGVLTEHGQYKEAEALMERIGNVTAEQNAGKDQRQRESLPLISMPHDHLARRASSTAEKIPEVVRKGDKWRDFSHKIGLDTPIGIAIPIFGLLWLLILYISHRSEQLAGTQQKVVLHKGKLSSETIYHAVGQSLQSILPR